MYDIYIPPTLDQVISESKMFGSDPAFRGVCCFTESKNERWSGYVLKLSYLHETGYYYEINEFGMGPAFLHAMQADDKLTADLATGMKWLGQCPKCQCDLFDAVKKEFHKVNSCSNAAPN